MTSEEIERLRMDERLKVVRGLEDNTMKSACRRVNSDHLESNAIIGIIFETIHRSILDKSHIFEMKMRFVHVDS